MAICNLSPSTAILVQARVKMKAPLQNKHKKESLLGMVVHAYNLSLKKLSEARRSGVHG
jgi:hypothetical protein